MSVSGRFIVFEGIDGSGKTTQLRLAAAHLRARGYRVIETREPGGSPGAEAIRSLLLNGPADKWSARTEALLFTAARRDHWEKTIQPALERGDIVLCDRFVDSTRAYQTAGRGIERSVIDRLHELMIGIEPDLVLILDLRPEIARQRFVARGDTENRFEQFPPSFHRQLAEAFRALATEAPNRRRLIAADRPPAELGVEIAALLDHWL